jgi:hypothetical protein
MPAFPVSGITGLPSSGTLPASGSQSGFDGPWLIESQDLTVQYVRVPNMTSGTSVGVTSLSATNTRTASVGGTSLHAIVRASYRRYKENNTTYSTSTWSQPQRFTVQGQSNDEFGNTYGTVSGTILGPVGRIVTSQPYYRRVPWTSATSATEVTEAVTLSIMPYRQIVQVAGGLAYQGIDALDIYGKFNPAALSNVFANAFIGAFAAHPNYNYGWAYNLPGPYNTGQESQAEFRQFLDEIGTALFSLSLFPLVTSPSPSSGYVLPSQGLSYYRPERHDYS